MTKQEIEAKIKQAENNKYLPEALKVKYIAGLKDKMSKLSTTPDKKPSTKHTIKNKKQKPPKVDISKRSTPQIKNKVSLKDFKEKKNVTVNGKTITKSEADYCEKVVAAWKERKEKARVSAKKSAAKPEGKKAEDKVETVIEKANAGKFNRAELLRLIKDTKALLAALTSALNKKNK